MTLLTLGLYLPLWFHYGLAQSSILDSFISFPAGKDVISLFVFLSFCVSVCVCVYVAVSVCQLYIHYYACTGVDGVGM